MESNKDDPIVIDTNEEDHCLSTLKQWLLPHDKYNLSKEPVEESSEESNKPKVCA